jgi:hypothetical protein
VPNDPHRFTSQPLDALFQVSLMPSQFCDHETWQRGAGFGGVLACFLLHQRAGERFTRVSGSRIAA